VQNLAAVLGRAVLARVVRLGPRREHLVLAERPTVGFEELCLQFLDGDPLVGQVRLELVEVREPPRRDGPDRSR